MARLIIRSGDAIEHEIELGDRDLRIGRGDQNDVVLRDPNKTVSRFHAELRRDGSGYVLLDLNSQNGIWMGGRRQPKVTLASDIPVTLGGYTLTLEATPAAGAAAADATVRNAPGPAQALAASDTIQRAPAAPGATPPAAVAAAESTARTPDAPAKPVPAGGRGKARPAAGAPSAPGLVAYLARLPRPVLFGGFGAFMVIVVGIGQFAGSFDSKSGSTTTAAAPAPAPSNDEIIAMHLAEARALLGRGEADEAITAHLDPILLIDPAQPDALELKTRAHDLQAAAAARVAAATAAPAPVAVAPAAAAAVAPAPRRGSAAAATRGPSEVLADLNARDKDASDRYDRARAALTANQYARAVTVLAELQRDRPGFRDVPQLLARAREGAQAQAQTALDDGARLEAAGDLSGALLQFEHATQADGAVSDAADKAIARIRDRMKVDGADAFRRAKQYDALGRVPEAVALYDRAYRYLPDTDPNRQAAKERLDVLRARP